MDDSDVESDAATVASSSKSENSGASGSRRRPEPYITVNNMKITEKNLMHLVFGVQTQGWANVEKVGKDLGFKPGEATGIFKALSVRASKQDATGIEDSFSVTTFPKFYDELIELLHKKHVEKSGKDAYLENNAWSQALELSSKYINFPEPSACGGVDYRKICMFLSSCLRGVAPAPLDVDSDRALKNALKDMQVNASTLSKSRVEIAAHLGEQLAEVRAIAVAKRRKKGPPKIKKPIIQKPDPSGSAENNSPADEDMEEQDPARDCDEPLRDRIADALVRMPALNPAEIPLNLLLANATSYNSS